jgi:uncharacterized membrane protein YkoI
MRTAHAGLAVLAGCLLLAPAWADDTKDSPKGEAKVALAKEILGKSNIGLDKALQAAQKKVPDGKPLAVRLEMKDGKGRFGTYLMAGDTIKEVEIDAATGDVLRSRDQQASERVNGETLAQARQAQRGATISIAQAIDLSTKKVRDGKPFEAEVRMKDGKAVVEVELLAGDRFVKVQVDAADGKSVTVEEPTKK